MTEIFFSVENSYNVNFPEGGGGGIPISIDGVDRIRVKIKTPQKSLGLPANSPPPKKKNSLEQNWPAKKSMLNFRALKISRKYEIL